MTFLSLFCFCFTFLFSVRVSRRWIQRWKCNCSTDYVCQWALETHSNLFKYKASPLPHFLLVYSNSFRLPNCRTLDFHSRNRTTDAPHMQQQTPHLLYRPVPCSLCHCYDRHGMHLQNSPVKRRKIGNRQLKKKDLGQFLLLLLVVLRL